jgi:hypothetical protein
MYSEYVSDVRDGFVAPMQPAVASDEVTATCCNVQTNETTISISTPMKRVRLYVRHRHKSAHCHHNKHDAEHSVLIWCNSLRHVSAVQISHRQTCRIHKREYKGWRDLCTLLPTVTVLFTKQDNEV